MKRPREAAPTWQSDSPVSAASAASPLAELAALLGAALPDANAVPPMPQHFEVFNAEHEDALLREPWPSAGAPGHRTRPCVVGRRCMAMQPCMPGHEESGGVVLSEAMSPSELLEFERSGAHPALRRPCILCARANVMDAYLRLRRARGGTGVGAPGYVLNWYANPVGEEGGYAAAASIPFPDDGDSWMGVFSTVMAFTPDQLRLVQDEVTHRWRVDQSAIKHNAPRTGTSTGVDETLRRFVESR